MKIFVSFCHVHTPCLQFSCFAFLFAYWAAAMKGCFGHLRRAFWSHISNGAWEGREATCLCFPLSGVGRRSNDNDELLYLDGHHFPCAFRSHISGVFFQFLRLCSLDIHLVGRGCGIKMGE
jgi:hypothetical protein